MANKKQPSATPDFETALKELETIIERMESQDLSLEDMLKDYERGTALSAICQQSLEAAEIRVQKLTRSAEGIKADALDITKPSA